MNIVCVSDTHTDHRRFNVPVGDLLIHAGDLTASGRVEQAASCLRWLAEQPHKHKVVIAGNHDWCFLREPKRMAAVCRDFGLVYLCDGGAEVDGLKIWGSPYTPEFAGWAFMQYRGADMRRHWDLIPDDLDILITHGPPQDILDLTKDGEHAGCEDLRQVVEKKKPRLHVFGHIHESAGAITVGETRFVNAARSVARVQMGADAVMVEWSKAI